MKKFSKVLILSAVMALPFSISASNHNDILSDVKVTMSSVRFSDDGCTMTVRGRTADGHRFKIKGSCEEVLATLEKL